MGIVVGGRLFEDIEMSFKEQDVKIAKMMRLMNNQQNMAYSNVKSKKPNKTKNINKYCQNPVFNFMFNKKQYFRLKKHFSPKNKQMPSFGKQK